MSTLKPFYQDDSATLYLGDCMEVMRALPDEAADLIIADPPYGIAYQGRFRVASPMFDIIEGDRSTELAEALIPAAARLLRGYRHLYVFGRYPWKLPATFTEPVELIWDKAVRGLGDLSQPWGPAHEVITFAAKEGTHGVGRGDGRLAAKLRRGSVIRVQRLNGGQVNRHPTEKPVDLIRVLVEASSLIGETVLDPCAGSGTTLAAAVLEGRKAIGIEIDPKHCQTIARRLATLTRPLDGFFTEEE